eukprot:4644220-Prorocentrum_lima.AAC.1
MTSSLVGSEMCIRDRFVRCAHPFGWWTGRRAAPPRGTPWPPPPAPPKRSCLLYTSDAADDM